MNEPMRKACKHGRYEAHCPFDRVGAGVLDSHKQAASCSDWCLGGQDVRIDYEAAAKVYLDDDMHGNTGLIALCAREVVDAAIVPVEGDTK